MGEYIPNLMPRALLPITRGDGRKHIGVLGEETTVDLYIAQASVGYKGKRKVFPGYEFGFFQK